MTSGITSGELTMPMNRVRPVKRLNLVMATAAKLPNKTEAVAVSSAILRESTKPSTICSSRASSSYHLSEKPVQEVTSGLSLKLKVISVTIGRYRKAKLANSQTRAVIWPARLIIFAHPTQLQPGIC